jgi:3-oxoacyl-[acyl-carrier-protein] synthase II
VSKRRVVITGLGAVTPLGNSTAAFWNAAITGQSGIAPITLYDASSMPTKIAGEVKNFDPDAVIGRRESRRMDRYAWFAYAAALEAIDDAKLPEARSFRDETGVVVATGIGGILTIRETVESVVKVGNTSKISPFFVPKLMGNAASAQISMRHGLRGPMYAVSSACASSNDAMANAYTLIANGEARAIITGGCEATVGDVAMGGFCNMKALSTRNDEPARASRPFDRDRDGFVLSEGGAVLVFEEQESAQARGAKIYAEVLGYGQSADAHDIVAVDPTGGGVELAIRRALSRTGIALEEVDYINAHGTSTPIGDPAESKAIESVFGEHAKRIAVSSTKSMHGHALGAAGALEGVLTVLAIVDGQVPPTINLEHQDPECRLDYVPNLARRMPIRVALSNSFGFGGHNNVVVFAKFKRD